jgi:hypothetical protein
MNLASPAPRVETAQAEKAPSPDVAVTEPARPSESVRVEKAENVEPAVAGVKEQVISQPQRKLGGISVEALRGESGADFEGNAAVLRGAPKKDILKRFLPLFFDERDFVAYGEVLRFVLIKGDCCFVFTEQDDPSPVYAIPLDEVYAIMEDAKRPDKFSVTISPTSNKNMSKEDLKTVLFKYKKDSSQAFQFTFNTHSDKSLAKRFLDTVERCSSGKDNKGPVRASVMHAKDVGAVAEKGQPMI